MSLACTIVVSLMCFQGNVKTHLIQGAIAPHKVVTGRNYTATVWSNDNIYVPDWRVMNNGCAGGRCYRYLKHCISARKKITCDYSFGVPGDDSALEIRLEAHSNEELKRAETKILLLSPKKTEESDFSLSTFTVESETHMPEGCPRHEANRCIP
jgi:hypothetical protein